MENLFMIFNSIYLNIKLKKQIKITYKSVSNVVIEDSAFIYNTICKYIYNKINKNYSIHYVHNNKTISIEYYTQHKTSTIFLKKLLKRVIFMMDFCDIYKNTNIKLYDTPFKKSLPCKKHSMCNKSIGPDNVNSGYNYLNNIVIYRKEEIKKLLIHEMIHLLDIDIKYEDDKIKSLFVKKICNKNTREFLLNESYVETWACIINIFLTQYESNVYKKNHKYDFKLYLERFKKEKMASLYYGSKILHYYNFNTLQSVLKKNNKCSSMFIEDTNVFCYFIIKMINLFYINKFLELFFKHQRLNKKYNYKTYVQFVDSHFLLMDKYVTKTIKIIKKNKNNNNTTLHLKLSIT